ASVVFDIDGPGGNPPLIIIGRSFLTAGGQSVRGLACWDGHAWSQFGPPINGAVRALIVFDDDGPAGPHAPELYVGGTSVVPGSALARFDAAAQAWSTAPFGPVAGDVWTMTTLRDTLNAPAALCIAG